MSTLSHPLPPDELIDRVLGSVPNEPAEETRTRFLETGLRSRLDLERALTAVGDTFSQHDRILEFGCGCGRIMRWMSELVSSCALVGTDVDARAIAWASEALPFARFDVNQGLPPTHYDDGEFDLVLNHSVFTHLDQNYQDRWLAELQRITSPNGIIVLSVHGEHAFRATEEQLVENARQGSEWREILERDGIFYTSEDSLVGSAFPDFYHTTFHAPWYIFEHWSRWFDVLAFLPRSSLDFQDQVVLRRPDVVADRVPPPIRARPRGAVSAPPPPVPSETLVGHPVEPSQVPSRFGRAGMVARRALFRVARPILYAQHRVDRALEARIASIDARLDQRMPPLISTVLRQQARRIDHLDRELEDFRNAAKETASGRRRHDERS
jgi:SAM-dependent methyltransferase